VSTRREEEEEKMDVEEGVNVLAMIEIMLMLYGGSQCGPYYLT